MTYDVAFRNRQALDPSGLDSIAACLHAIQAAAKDCRNAGKPFESDPAVLLLARHLGEVATGKMPDRAGLRSLCADELAELARKPILTTLARRGVSYDEDAKRTFHAEARKALRRLADSLQLEPGSFDIRVCAGGPAVSGEVILHGKQLYVQVSLSGFGPGDILFRRCSGRTDYCGERNHWAGIRELLDPTNSLRGSRPSCGSIRRFAQSRGWSPERHGRNQASRATPLRRGEALYPAADRPQPARLRPVLPRAWARGCPRQPCRGLAPPLGMSGGAGGPVPPGRRAPVAGSSGVNDEET